MTRGLAGTAWLGCFVLSAPAAIVAAARAGRPVPAIFYPSQPAYQDAIAGRPGHEIARDRLRADAALLEVLVHAAPTPSLAVPAVDHFQTAVERLAN